MTLKVLMAKLETIDISIGLLIHNDDYYGASILHDYKIKIEKEIESEYDRQTSMRICDNCNYFNSNQEQTKELCYKQNELSKQYVNDRMDGNINKCDGFKKVDKSALNKHK